HPELLEQERLPPDIGRNHRLWRRRYEDINDFEEHLDRSGTKIVKFFLHVSEEEQRKRFLARLDDPKKQWKLSLADLAERAYWDEYMAAYEEAITATSTKHAPWYVIPADHKYVMRTLVAGVLATTINRLGLAYPEVGNEQRRELDAARTKLRGEKSRA